MPVVGSRNASFLDSSGNRQGGKVLLDLNCNDTSALNGHPGNSVTTPEGQKVHQIQNTAKQINENYAEATAAGQKSWCEENSSDCAQFCTNAGQGLCSAEVMQALGASHRAAILAIASFWAPCSHPREHNECRNGGVMSNGPALALTLSLAGLAVALDCWPC